MIEISPLHEVISVTEIRSDNQLFVLNYPLDIYIQKLDRGLWGYINPEFYLFAYGDSKKEAFQHMNWCFALLYKDYTKDTGWMKNDPFLLKVQKRYVSIVKEIQRDRSGEVPDVVS